MVNRLFWDTNLFIYLIEAVAPFDKQVQQVIQAMRTHQYELITSALTVCETLVLPTQKQDQALLSAYRQLFANIKIIALDKNVADLFAFYRSQAGIKTPDALQLACAQYAGAKILVTNDNRLEKFSHQDLNICSIQKFLKNFPVS